MCVCVCARLPGKGGGAGWVENSELQSCNARVKFNSARASTSAGTRGPVAPLQVVALGSITDRAACGQQTVTDLQKRGSKMTGHFVEHHAGIAEAVRNILGWVRSVADSAARSCGGFTKVFSSSCRKKLLPCTQPAVRCV
jgi:hypothetical protein